MSAVVGVFHVMSSYDQLCCVKHLLELLSHGWILFGFLL